MLGSYYTKKCNSNHCISHCMVYYRQWQHNYKSPKCLPIHHRVWCVFYHWNVKLNGTHVDNAFTHNWYMFLCSITNMCVNLPTWHLAPYPCYTFEFITKLILLGNKDPIVWPKLGRSLMWVTWHYLSLN